MQSCYPCLVVNKIRLSNFRNFKEKLVEFHSDITCIVGPNASGKSNILESLYLLSTGKSFRAKIEEEMIRYAAEIARISAEFGIGNQESGTEKARQKKIHDSQFAIPNSSLEVVLTRGQVKVGGSKIEKACLPAGRWPRKKLLVNGVAKRLIDFAGNFKVVLFGPWDLDLVTAAPSLRRKFLDNVLSQVDREYHRAILSYERGLRQRNRLLFRIREDLPAGRQEIMPRSQLLFWDQLLIKTGNYISQRRAEFIEFANSVPQLPSTIYQLQYDPSAISEARLAQHAEEEVAAATTLVGPHRDDFIFKVKEQESKRVKENRELARFGSRGEQRMAVLWLKLAELAFIEEKTQEKPTLLLDDIFSELDHEHRKIVMRICQNQQTIITTADKHFIEGFGRKNLVITLHE